MNKPRTYGYVNLNQKENQGMRLRINDLIGEQVYVIEPPVSPDGHLHMFQTKALAQEFAKKHAPKKITLVRETTFVSVTTVGLALSRHVPGLYLVLHAMHNGQSGSIRWSPEQTWEQFQATKT
jgi:hypothetical protein